MLWRKADRQKLHGMRAALSVACRQAASEVIAGHIERVLAALHPPAFTVGVGLDAARVSTIFPQPHDRAMDEIVTETDPKRAVSPG